MATLAATHLHRHPHTRTARAPIRTVVIGLALLGALGLPACRDLNSDLALSEGVTLEALSPDRTTPAYPLISRVVTDRPSLQPLTMDRSHWTTRRIVVPVSGVEHRPIYATGPTYADETPRQAGQFPTIYSALDLGTTESAWNEGFEAMAWPFWAGLDIALMPARAAVQPPWTTVESPLTRYQRAPEGTASPAMLDDPAAPPVPGVNVAPTVPSTAYPRWIWRNGNWYLWQPGDPEPWYVPQRQPDVKGVAPATDDRATQSPKPRPRWFFRDGRWVRDDAEPASAPTKPQEPKP